MWFSGYVTGCVTASVVIITAVGTSSEGPGYKQGQIDALTGKVKYVLIENPDKTKEWVRDDSTRKN